MLPVPRSCDGGNSLTSRCSVDMAIAGAYPDGASYLSMARDIKRYAARSRIDFTVMESVGPTAP